MIALMMAIPIYRRVVLNRGNTKYTARVSALQAGTTNVTAATYQDKEHVDNLHIIDVVNIAALDGCCFGVFHQLGLWAGVDYKPVNPRCITQLRPALQELMAEGQGKKRLRCKRKAIVKDSNIKRTQDRSWTEAGAPDDPPVRGPWAGFPACRLCT